MDRTIDEIQADYTEAFKAAQGAPFGPPYKAALVRCLALQDELTAAVGYAPQRPWSRK